MLAPYVLFQDGNFSTRELAKATEKLCHTHHTGKASIRLNMNAFKIYTQVSLSLLRFSISLYHRATTRDGPRMQEYAVHADCSHMREYADADENIIHINHI